MSTPTTDLLATLIDECYQRGLDGPEAATFLRAAGVTLAPTPPDALPVDMSDYMAGYRQAQSDAAPPSDPAALLAELEAGVEGLPKWDKRSVPGGFHVNLAAVLDLIRKAKT